MKKKVIVGICIILAAVVIGLVVWKISSSGDDAEGDGEITLYADSVGMLTGTGLGTQNRFAGVVEAQNTLKIQLESDQKVKEIFVEKGQSVEIGTPLFEYDTEDLSLKLEQANLELEKISNSIDTINAQIDELAKAKKKAPSSEQLSYTTQIQEAQMNVKQEEYNYKVKELEIDRLKKSLESSQMTSTIAGIVQEINENPSFDNYTGEQQPFMSILAVGKYRVKGTISEQNMQNIYPGMPVIVHSRVDESIVWSGTIESIDTEKPISGNNNGYVMAEGGGSEQASKYPFYVTLDSSDGLMLGQHVYLEPNLGQEEKDGMWLMSSYIVQDDGEPYVWAAGEDDKLEKRTVTLGEHDEEMDTWEITDGLKPTDYIVWPSEDCKKGAPVQKNIGGMMGGMNSGMDMIPADGDDGFGGEDIISPDGDDIISPDGENVVPGNEDGVVPEGENTPIPEGAGIPEDGGILPETEAAS
ncbi:MAG: HlyD family efflux transporter periplasmic adaptor subunit [Lachnospiraceae bacterium]|nr:HlyD family efflux transporter periplasmic adaptor subunit [Lachnospiraceae bacterium]